MTATDAIDDVLDDLYGEGQSNSTENVQGPAAAHLDPENAPFYQNIHTSAVYELVRIDFVDGKRVYVLADAVTGQTQRLQWCYLEDHNVPMLQLPAQSAFSPAQQIVLAEQQSALKAKEERKAQEERAAAASAELLAELEMEELNPNTTQKSSNKKKKKKKKKK
jgi:hypothetical protein